MQLPYSEKLNIAAFSNLFRDTSACYKFFWFQAIVTKILEGKEVVSFDALANEMIAEAWYMVVEYHLNLSSVTDSVEEAVKRLQEISGFKPLEKKEKLIAYLENCDDKRLKQIKTTLMINVPYRLQAPLLKSFDSEKWNVGLAELAKNINKQESRLIYSFSDYNRMKTEIILSPDWREYILENQGIIEGWIQFYLVQYLQKKNPNVPGIIEKIHAPETRKLERVKDLWKLLVTLQPIQEIYNGELLSDKNISIDHFVPWSYVANDELWNLHPTTKAINSSKSNHLPNWDNYFYNFSRMEYLTYSLKEENEYVKKAFYRCADEHLNSEEIRNYLYAPGLSESEFRGRLKAVIQPVYQSAKNAGFSEWILK